MKGWISNAEVAGVLNVHYNMASNREEADGQGHG